MHHRECRCAIVRCSCGYHRIFAFKNLEFGPGTLGRLPIRYRAGFKFFMKVEADLVGPVRYREQLANTAHLFKLNPTRTVCHMCNLYSNTIPADAMRQLFDVASERNKLGNAEPLPAILPKHMAPVVRKAEDGVRELVPLSWGFRTTKKSRKTGAIIQPAAWNNARDDMVRTSGLWKGSFEDRRCLVPASSFCEAKGRNPACYHWIALNGDKDRPPFAFIGLIEN